MPGPCAVCGELGGPLVAIAIPAGKLRKIQAFIGWIAERACPDPASDPKHAACRGALLANSIASVHAVFPVVNCSLQTSILSKVAVVDEKHTVMVHKMCWASLNHSLEFLLPKSVRGFLRICGCSSLAAQVWGRSSHRWDQLLALAAPPAVAGVCAECKFEVNLAVARAFLAVTWRSPCSPRFRALAQVDADVAVTCSKCATSVAHRLCSGMDKKPWACPICEPPAPLKVTQLRPRTSETVL